MRDGRKVRVEDLLFPKLVSEAGKAMAYDEAGVRPALHPLFAHRKIGPAFMFGALARTATLFLVDHNEFAEVLMSAGEAPVLPQLPPLPYPRVAVECLEDAVWKMGNSEEHLSDLEIFFITEMERGDTWVVVLLLRTAIAEGQDPIEAQPYLDTFAVFKDGRVEHFYNPAEPEIVGDYIVVPEYIKTIEDTGVRTMVYEPDDPRAQSMRAIPIEFAHLVNARGVTVEPVGVSRPQRRRFERQKLVHPQVYFVKIGGELTESYPGRGDREYHCRWLVRGHWRHFADGSKTWVRPYIKGPAGAPWRGRPVYVVEPEEE